jgi:hypothetical protein
MNKALRDGSSESGVILVQVAIAIVVLMAFMTFVMDYGVLWVSRGEAQNAADAGALAGAIARAYDDPANPPSNTGMAAQSAEQAAEQNMVWNAAPVAQVSWNCPAGVAGSCVRVDVYRNGQFGSAPLPMLFGSILNMSQQGVRATATARVATANSTNCMRPFSVADKWAHVINPVDQFNRWRKVGSAAVEDNPHDQYTPPSQYGPGTGYTVQQDLGTQLVLKGGNNPNSTTGAIEPGWFLPVQLPDGAGGYIAGANDYRAAIATCIGNPVTIGQYLPTETGAMVGPTSQGVGDLTALDPGATYDPSTHTVTGSCAPACAPISPRIVPISVFDMDEFQWRNAANDWTSSWGTYPASPCPIGGKCVRITNILGFFVEQMQGQDVMGRLIMYPGQFVVGAPSLGGGAGFLQTIQLVQ